VTDTAFGAQGASVSLSASTASSRVTLPTGFVADQVRIFNSGTVVAFVEFGGSTVTATVASSLPIAAGAVEVLSCRGSSHIAAITAASLSVVYFTLGKGL
jgi:hypothetical protein